MSINGDLADSEYGDDFIEQEESFSDTTSEKYDAKADKRAHHNALERKRRDHIKDSFSSLKNAVPTFNGEKASRAQILKKAAEYISIMRSKNTDHQRDIDSLKRENKILEEKIVRALEQMKNGVSLNNSLYANANVDEKTNYNSFGNLVELDASSPINDDDIDGNNDGKDSLKGKKLSNVYSSNLSNTTKSPNKKRKVND